jgi:hypothetical protein
MRLVIELRGGNVVDCYSDSADVEITIVDWDNIECGGLAKGTSLTSMSQMPLDTRDQLKKLEN